MRGSPKSGRRKSPSNAEFKTDVPHSKIVNIWRSMMRRCYSPKEKSYPNYGGRGISVDPRWHNCATFIADMGERQDGMTIERIDNDGPYSKENCVWASRKAQARNKRTSVILNHNGISKNVKDWETFLGLGDGTLRYHLSKGRDIEYVLRLKKAAMQKEKE